MFGKDSNWWPFNDQRPTSRPFMSLSLKSSFSRFWKRIFFSSKKNRLKHFFGSREKIPASASVRRNILFITEKISNRILSRKLFRHRHLGSVAQLLGCPCGNPARNPNLSRAAFSQNHMTYCHLQSSPIRSFLHRERELSQSFNLYGFWELKISFG